MKYLLRNILVPLEKKIDLEKIVLNKTQIPRDSLLNLEIKRRSLDSRQRNNLKYNFTLIIETDCKLKSNKFILEYNKKEQFIRPEEELSNKNPIIIGAGPAGLFAALELVENGFEPLIFEKGSSLSERKKKVEEFWSKSILDESSNVQFGEGGAGTFSDAKLTARNRNKFSNKVLNKLVEFGAEREILFEALPHLGTNGIHRIVKKIRKYLEGKGAKFYWKSNLEEIEVEKNRIRRIKINNEYYEPEIIFLALGNSSRETFKMLVEQGIRIENKPFAVGFRIEHPQDYINKAFYGAKTDYDISGPANYKLRAKYKNRGIYSFCMCPGGFVVASASEKKSVVTNGMSLSQRDNFYANSAIVTTIDEKDYGKELLAGMRLQRRMEKKAFEMTSSYNAPIQRAEDYLKGKIRKTNIESSYRPGTVSSNLNDLFSKEINKALRSGLKSFNRRYGNFIKQGVLIGPETRTSSPLRILRDRRTLRSVSAENLVPIGEGAGYAGGIISSAADGLRAASRFMLVKK